MRMATTQDTVNALVKNVMMEENTAKDWYAEVTKMKDVVKKILGVECKDCSRLISEEEYAQNKGKCDRCSIGDYYG